MIERKTQRSPITKQQFYQINRDIKVARTTKAKTADIAKKHGVSDETVRTIRSAGTWPKFEALKQARRARQVERRKPYIVNEGLDEARDVHKVLTGKSAPVKATGAPKQESFVFEPPVSFTLGEYKKLMALIPQVKTLMEWHDSYQKAAEELAQRVLSDNAADDGPETVNGHYAVFNDLPVEQTKKKRLGFLRGRR